MKRLLLCLLVLLMVLLCFSSCEYINGFTDIDDGHTEHTFEYIAYESGHFKQFTCGCPSPEIMEMHRDANEDGICDLCGYLIIVTEKIPLTQYEPWLSSLAKGDVKEIITYSSLGYTSPELQTIISTTNQDIIGQIIDEYRQVVVEKNDFIDYELLPGSFKVEFYLDDGSVKKLDFYGGGYFYGGYPVSNTPGLDREEFADVSRRYSLLTYKGFEKIYYHDMMSSLTEGICVSRINPQMLEFVECKCDPTSDPEVFSRFYYYIETDDGGTFFDEGKHLMFDGKMYDVINFDRINLSGINTVKSAHEEMFNDGRIAFVENYYGIFDSGAVVAMVSDDKTGYDEALWSEIVAGYTIRYSNGNRIVVLYDGEFYTLPEAYENGYLTEADIFAIYKLRS